jgi:hypothetical protein
MKKKEKERTFLVIYQEVMDGEIFINRMTSSEIEHKFNSIARDYKFYPQDSFAIIDGDVIKSFSMKLDVNKLENIK